MTQYEDQELTCKDCDSTFTLSASERQFFAERQLTTPKRCQACRRAKKERNGGSFTNSGAGEGDGLGITRARGAIISDTDTRRRQMGARQT
jgi:hypothetical protein